MDAFWLPGNYARTGGVWRADRRRGASGAGVPRAGLLWVCCRVLEQALALYRGQPLAGCDYPWADAHVRDLSARCADLLLRAGHARLTRGDPHAALQAAEQGLQLDQFNETLWRLALEAEHALGLRESVTRRYRQLTRTLDEQLGLRPSQETRHFYRRLLGQA